MYLLPKFSFQAKKRQRASKQASKQAAWLSCSSGFMACTLRCCCCCCRRRRNCSRAPHSEVSPCNLSLSLSFIARGVRAQKKSALSSLSPLNPRASLCSPFFFHAQKRRKERERNIRARARLFGQLSRVCILSLSLSLSLDGGKKWSRRLNAREERKREKERVDCGAVGMTSNLALLFSHSFLCCKGAIDGATLHAAHVRKGDCKFHAQIKGKADFVRIPAQVSI